MYSLKFSRGFKKQNKKNYNVIRTPLAKYSIKYLYQVRLVRVLTTGLFSLAFSCCCCYSDVNAFMCTSLSLCRFFKVEFKIEGLSLQSTTQEKRGVKNLAASGFKCNSKFDSETISMEQSLHIEADSGRRSQKMSSIFVDPSG